MQADLKDLNKSGYKVNTSLISPLLLWVLVSGASFEYYSIRFQGEIRKNKQTLSFFLKKNKLYLELYDLSLCRTCVIRFISHILAHIMYIFHLTISTICPMYFYSILKPKYFDCPPSYYLDPFFKVNG